MNFAELIANDSQPTEASVQAAKDRFIRTGSGKDLNLCRDCQTLPPLYLNGYMYKRCAPCQDAYDSKRYDNRQAKLRRQAEKIASA